MTPKQAALSHIDKIALVLRDPAHALIKNVLLMSNISMVSLQLAMRKLNQHGRVALHFHPDRVDSRGLRVVEGLIKDGVYKSQFETHISNGQLSPELGGPRDYWENQLFGQCYSGIKHRPKYGALDLGLCSLGPAPRFGSCYFLTTPQVLTRSTFSYMDSYRLPKEKGTINCFDGVLAALLSESFERHYALGIQGLKPAKLIDYLTTDLAHAIQGRFTRTPSCNLDHYIEAQIHGDVSLDNDIEILVADPSFKDSHVGDLLQTLCDGHDIQLLWHGGYQLSVEEVPSDFRGVNMPMLAQNIAQDNMIDAAILGQAAYTLCKQPTSWSERSSHAKKVQELKLLWHVLVRYGAINPQY
ncbi:DUF3626 domain-containing protein [Shewanella glacialimarina]|uniref:DUF3626 domain-containing protein n=1 Tax=Shewanella glacialimarina TaxID=2590884 RepID=UPI001CF92BC2|nr:DUF3626 domain-containing protein [Shewanella glacialimarina]UCX05831.1 DUF3626 domain-containing protein [Shewanella glacialimarina]